MRADDPNPAAKAIEATQRPDEPDRPRRPIRLAYLVSHPIQYQAPLLRRIASEPDIDLTVFFGSDFSVKGYKDEGFGVAVKWDTPLLDGYKYEFLPSLRDKAEATVASPISHGILSRLQGKDGQPGFDVLWVHGYSTVNSMQAMLAAQMLHIPVLLRAESWLRDRGRSRSKLAAKKLYFAMLRQLVSAVLPIGTLNAEYWSHYLGATVPQFLMPYAVDNDWFQRKAREAKESRAELLAELDLDPARPVILFASKLQTRKLCSDLVTAWARLSDGPGIEPAPYLVIVGDGEERANLEAQAKGTGFAGVRFCGFRNQSELPRFFDLASMFVLPSRHEPWGLIVNEAMNAGCAVIVTDDVGSAPDMITDGVEGFIYPVGDIDALTAALRKVLATPGTAQRMGQAALERVSAWNFDADIAGLRRALHHVTRRGPGGIGG